MKGLCSVSFILIIILLVSCQSSGVEEINQKRKNDSIMQAQRDSALSQAQRLLQEARYISPDSNAVSDGK